jgi:Mrp family chromosome partitioning ATPase
LNDARAVLALLLADADFVVLHAASLGSSPAPLVWARVLDAAVLVVRPAHTRRESVVSAVEALALAGTNVVGTVLYTGPLPAPWSRTRPAPRRRRARV